MYEPIEALYETPQAQYGIIQINGEDAKIQLTNEFGETRTVATKTTKLQKRHARGGQSQNRIARLRLETIHNYLKLVGEKAEKAFLENGNPIIKALLIVGNGMKKDQIKQYINISVPFYVFPNDNDLQSLIQQMVSSETGIVDTKHNETIQSLVRDQMDLLTFGLNETTEAFHQNQLRTIYATPASKEQFNSENIKCTVVILQDETILKLYGGIIGVRFISV